MDGRRPTADWAGCGNQNCAPSSADLLCYQTFYFANEYGLASAAGVVVVIGTIIVATFALRTVFSLFKKAAR